MDGRPLKILITAGPTREHLDPVRYLSNGSSGRMGYALAEVAQARGHRVDLVSGPVNLAAPVGVNIIRVISAEEMLVACQPLFETCDVFIAVAAVADFRPKFRLTQKQPKLLGEQNLELVPTVDILRSLAARKRPDQVVVGFAAQTENLVAYAKAKMQRKNCDWIVANDVGRPGIGMEAADNAVILLSDVGKMFEFGPAPKAEVAAFLLDRVLDRGDGKSL